jgi:lysophospholipase L1-like esterase
MKQAPKLFIFSLIATIIFLAAAELCSRLVYAVFYKEVAEKESLASRAEYYIPDPQLGWIANPRFNCGDGKKSDFDCTVNSEGCHDVDIPIEKDNRVRVFCLGDSITEVRGLDYRLSYPKILERKLNAGSQVQAKKWEVYNCGVGDYGIAQEYLFLSQRLVKYRPDIVVLGYYLNDLRGFVPVNRFYVNQGMLRGLYENSRLIFFINKIVLKYAIKAQYKRWEKYRFNWEPLYKERKWISDKKQAYRMIELAEDDWGLGWKDDKIKLAEKFLGDFAALGRKYNYKLIVVVFPVDMQVYADFQDPYLYKPQKMLEKFCLDNQIAFVDLVPYLKEHKDRDLFRDQCHYTQAGLELVAERLFAAVRGH